MPERIVGKNADLGITPAVTTSTGPFLKADVTLLGKRTVDATLTIDINTEESTAYQTEAGAVADWKENEIIDGQWSIEGQMWFNTATAPDTAALLTDPALLFGKRGVVFYPNGWANPNSTTKPRYHGRGILTSAPISSPRGLSGIRFRILGDGPITRVVSGADA